MSEKTVLCVVECGIRLLDWLIGLFDGVGHSEQPTEMSGIRSSSTGARNFQFLVRRKER